MTSRRRYRAPTADGEALIDPPLSEAAKLIEQNRQFGAKFDSSSGFPADFRLAARRRMLSSHVISDFRDPERVTMDEPLILSGHQPELFHPGVWLKNFVTSSIAKSVGGTAVNLIIDNDTIRSASIRVPTGRPAAPEVVEVPFDTSGPEVPWQVRRILDEATFRRFAAAVHETMSPLLPQDRPELIVHPLWQHVVNVADEQMQRWQQLQFSSFVGKPLPESFIHEMAFRPVKLGECLSRGRYRLEREIGLVTQELPLAAVCGDLFLQFADAILTRHREFHEAYNRALAQYRSINRIRAHIRPMPDLSRDGDWFEMPFWLWTFREGRRRRVFVRQEGTGWEVSDHQGTGFDSSMLVGESSAKIQLIEWHVNFAPRALITTMYARLVLSDLFIHGIGGAKYDEVTDEIIRRFFGIEPPKYITATATFRLPIERPHVTIEDVRDARQKLRDVRYRPETFLRDPLTKQVPGLREQLQSLADEKREYVRTHDLRRCEEQVFARLDTINRAMHELMKPVEQELLAQHAQLQEDLRRADLLGSREFSFVLFPADDLPQRLLALSKVSA